MITIPIDSLPQNGLDLDDLREGLRDKKPVSKFTYFYYTVLLLMLAPFSVCAKTYRLACQLLRKTDPEVARLKKALKDHVITRGLKNVSNQEFYELAEKVGKFADPHVKELVIDVLSLGLKFSALKEVLKGANISIEGDNGDFFKKWKQFPICVKRTSSHNFDKEGCYSVKNPVFHEFLFWNDKDRKNTRFQMERTALFSIWYLPTSLLHLHDYFVYKRSGMQQGVFGNSEFTESHPIKVTFNDAEYKRRKEALEKAFNPDCLLKQHQ